MEENLFLITGAASGIGHNLAVYLLDQGSKLLLVDINREALESLFTESDKLKLLVGDVSKEETWLQSLELAKSFGQPISHLINCGGVIRPGFVSDFDLKDIDMHLDVNTKGTILGTTIIGREMKSVRKGHIINISSLAGIAPVPGLSLYTASKFAVRGFTLAAAAELKKSGVDVSVVCPDLVDTPMLYTQLNYPEESKLSFSGPKKILQTGDITQVILGLIKKPKILVCIPESRGLLSKIAGAWPVIGELFRNLLESKGKNALSKWGLR